MLLGNLEIDTLAMHLLQNGVLMRDNALSICYIWGATIDYRNYSVIGKHGPLNLVFYLVWREKILPLSK